MIDSKNIDLYNNIFSFFLGIFLILIINQLINKPSMIIIENNKDKN